MSIEEFFKFFAYINSNPITVHINCHSPGTFRFQCYTGTSSLTIIIETEEIETTCIVDSTGGNGAHQSKGLETNFSQSHCFPNQGLEFSHPLIVRHSNLLIIIIVQRYFI